MQVKLTAEPAKRKGGMSMYKKILFPTCLTEFCAHVFDFALRTAIEEKAKLWIYYGLGRVPYGESEVMEEIKKAEKQVAEEYAEKMKAKGFTDYAINVSDGDVVSEIVKLARNAAIDVIIMGTGTKPPIPTGEAARVGPLGETTAQTLLWAPCPVLVVPPALVPGLAR
ncbi:MAG: hypothetical protein DRH12_02695 [Deltaproteobacteria bacterium]|nr:MAG: hypothetical protein DRH12_02695 [Deltaproteobacteria bacterium]